MNKERGVTALFSGNASAKGRCANVDVYDVASCTMRSNYLSCSSLDTRHSTIWERRTVITFNASVAVHEYIVIYFKE